MNELLPVLSPRVIRRGMNLSILSAVLFSVYATVSAGAIFTGMLRSIHLTNPQISLVMSLPLLFPPMQIFGAFLQRRFFHRKRFWFTCSLTLYASFLSLIASVTVWFRLPDELAFPLFVTLFALMQIFAQLPASVNLSWLGELVPARESAAFWSRRTGFAGITTIVGGVGLGKLVDLLGRDNSGTYVVVVTIGIAFGILATLVFSGARDPDPAPRPGVGFLTLIVETLKNKEYRLLTAFFSYQSVFAWFSSAFIFVYLQAEDGMNFSMMTIQILLAISALVAFFSGYFFRIVGSKYGRKPVLILCSVLKAVEFVLWGTLFARNGFMDEVGGYWINTISAYWGGPRVSLPVGVIGSLPVFILGGFVNMGIMSAQMSLLTSLGNKRIQSIAIGLFGSIVGLSGFLVGLFSGYFYDILNSMDIVKESLFTPFNLLALFSSIGYCSSIFWLHKFHEVGAAPTGDVVKTLLSQNPFRGIYQANLLSQPMTENSRVDMLNQTAGNLVAEEIVQSLWNPSSRVRDGALLSLSRHTEKAADPKLLDEVIRLLDLPELGMQAMAARTLGRLQAQKAVPVLMTKVFSEDLTLAQCSVFALGLIGDKEALPVLRQLLDDPGRRELWPLAAEALSKIGDYKETLRMLPAYEQDFFSVTRRQCLIALIRAVLPDGQKAHPVFETEEKFPGSELERLIKLISLHPAWPEHAEYRVQFDREMELCDNEDYLGCATTVLAGELRLFGIVPETNPNSDEDIITDRFAPGGRMRDAFLNGKEYAPINLALQLKLWALLNFTALVGEERLILLGILMAAAASLPAK